jgi:hypothetical protein
MREKLRVALNSHVHVVGIQGHHGIAKQFQSDGRVEETVRFMHAGDREIRERCGLSGKALMSPISTEIDGNCFGGLAENVLASLRGWGARRSID